MIRYTFDEWQYPFQVQKTKFNVTPSYETYEEADLHSLIHRIKKLKENVKTYNYNQTKEGYLKNQRKIKRALNKSEKKLAEIESTSPHLFL